MDAVDRKILNILKTDAKRSYKKIADEIGSTPGTVHNRIKRMKAEGIIEKFTIAVNYDKLGEPVTVSMGIHVAPENQVQVIERLKKFGEVYELFMMMGAHEISLRARFKGMVELKEFTKRLNIEGITSYHFSIVVDKVKEEC